MANYMAEVAKLLGVEIGERFKLSSDFNDYVYDYYLTEHGIVLDEKGQSCVSTDLLCGILYGEYTIKRKPWKPKLNEMFYIVVRDGTVRYMHWDDCTNHNNYYKLGNFYRTYEEAEANRDKWISFYASDEILEV